MTCKNNIIYYLAFSLLVILRLTTGSVLFPLPLYFNYILLIIISSLFGLKIILDNHTFKEYLFIIILTILTIYIYIVANTYYIFLGFLSIMALKNVNIKTVIKIDIILKLTFLSIHSITYLFTWLIDYNIILDTIKISSLKGISHSLFFPNPNFVGALIIWLVFDFLCLKKEVKTKDIFIGLIIVIISYLICKSRTPLYIYILFIVLSFIKNQKILNFLAKYSYLILAIITLFIISINNVDNELFIKLNSLFSNRFMYSVAAYNKYGLSILPNALANNYSDFLIIDSFYVRSFINYGILTLIIVGTINIFIPKKNYKLEKRIFILASIYMFFEVIPIYTGLSLAYIIIGNTIINNKYKESDEVYERNNCQKAKRITC